MKKKLKKVYGYRVESRILKAAKTVVFLHFSPEPKPQNLGSYYFSWLLCVATPCGMEDFSAVSVFCICNMEYCGIGYVAVL